MRTNIRGQGIRLGVDPRRLLLAALAAGLLISGPVTSCLAQSSENQSQATELAKQLSNPIASLISLPFQMNWDEGLGADEEGRRFLMNIQPVMPFALNDDWNLIARVIMPFLAQPAFGQGGQASSGMGDILASAFVSPSRGGLTWGAGPVIGLPVTSDPTLGNGKYTLGPTFVVLKQFGPWTTGGLINHVWSVGGDSGRAEVNQTFLQPFLSYGKSGWTFSANTESAANWEASSGEEWTVPINLMVSKVTRLGPRPISLQAGPRFYAAAPDGGPSWGFRAAITLIFPAG